MNSPGSGTSWACDQVATPSWAGHARHSCIHARVLAAKCCCTTSTCLWRKTGKGQRKVGGRGSAHNLLIGIFLGKLWVQPECVLASSNAAVKKRIAIHMHVRMFYSEESFSHGFDEYSTLTIMILLACLVKGACLIKGTCLVKGAV